MAGRPDRLLRVLLHWTALTTVVFWLPLVRGAFDGPSYRWAGFGFHGAGTEGDYWFLALGTALAAAMLALGWRGARMPFHALVVGWHGYLGAGATWLALTRPEQFTFSGDTLGIHVSLAIVGPLLFGGFALAALVWVVRDLRSGRERDAVPWTRANTARLGVLAGFLPIQFALLRFDAVGNETDVAGVLVTIAQWLLVGWAIRPREPEAQNSDHARSATSRKPVTMR
ncbi:MAG: hypothetical protein R3199_02795 [Gemmatimonadota bacterium]|nr:hypothetical protein [Gemmatimonadota bacterium]